jgi:hypothetical protein
MHKLHLYIYIIYIYICNLYIYIYIYIYIQAYRILQACNFLQLNSRRIYVSRTSLFLIVSMWNA